MAASSAPPLFIVGCSRSGTTLLRLMLTQHADLHIPPESEFLLSLHGQTETYRDFTEPHHRWFFIRDLQTTEVSMGAYAFPIFDLGVKEAEQAIADRAPTDFAGAAAALFEASARRYGKERWGDKTPHYVRHVEWLADSFPRAQFLHMIRDGRDVARSRVDAGFTPSLRQSARHWVNEVQQGRRSGAFLTEDRYKELFFENLVRDPVPVLQDLCDWIDLEYDDQMLYFHEDDETPIPDEHEHLHEQTDQPIDPSRAQAWKEELPPRKVAEIENIAGPLLTSLGYEVTEARVPLWLRGARSIHSTLTPYLRPYTRPFREMLARHDL
jgi:hypothetical protein